MVQRSGQPWRLVHPPLLHTQPAGRRARRVARGRLPAVPRRRRAAAPGPAGGAGARHGGRPLALHGHRCVDECLCSIAPLQIWSLCGMEAAPSLFMATGETANGPALIELGACVGERGVGARHGGRSIAPCGYGCMGQLGGRPSMGDRLANRLGSVQWRHQSHLRAAQASRHAHTRPHARPLRHPRACRVPV